MTTITVNGAARAPIIAGRRIGIALSTLAVLALGADAAGKLIAPAMMIASTLR